MAGAVWSWTKSLTVAALLLSAAAVFAQSPGSGLAGTLAGRLTDAHSKPLSSATVTVRNEATGAESHTTTQKNGAYRFSGLEPGEYTLRAESPQLGHGQVEGIVVVAGHEARVLAALNLEPGTAVPVLAGLPKAESRKAGLPKTASHEAESPEWTAEKSGSVKSTGLSPYVNATESAGSTYGLKPVPSIELSSSSTDETGSQRILPAVAEEKAAETVPSEPVTAAETSTLTANELQALPAGGRRWQDFVLETQTGASSSQGQAAQGAATFGVDGVNQGLAFGGTNGASQGSTSASGGAGGSSTGESALGQAWTGGHGLALSEVAIRRVRTANGAVEASANRSSGGRVNVETEHGSNALHGQAFLFDRQKGWGAKNPFAQWVRETAPATLTTVPVFTAEAFTPSDIEMTWGFGLGSKIRKNKLYWYAAMDNFLRNNPGLATVKHPDKFFDQPTNDQMQVLSARLGLSSVNPVAEGLRAYSSLLETLGGLLGPTQRSTSQWVGFGRLDWQANERNRFTLEGIGAHWEAPGGGLTRVSENYGSHSFGSSQAEKYWLMGRWETYLTPNLLAVTQGSVGREVLGARPGTPSAYEQTLLSGNVWGQLPQIVVDSRYGFMIGNPSRFGEGSYPDERLYQGKGMLDWVRGNLLVRTGFEVSHNTDAISLLRNQTGTYYYSSVENFASDALSFAAFGLSGQLDPLDQHNCDQTGKVWRDSSGQLHGLGYLPCYSYYSQMIGPTNWWLSTNDWAGYTTAQWQPKKQIVLSAGLRFEREQSPPAIAKVDNPALPLTEKQTALGNNWGPRLGLAVGSGNGHWPLLRLGYGMYFGRTENATLETALTQTGSLKGDLYYFLRPTDNLNAGGAPPFPYVLSGNPGSAVKPGAVEFAPNYRNPEIHQAEATIEETLPGHIELTASAEVSLGRRLPISIDANIDPAAQPQTITYSVVDGAGLGPIKTPQLTVPFYTGRLNPEYQQISEIFSRANSTYEAMMLKLVRNSRRGLSLRARYTYAHAMDWNPNESLRVASSNVLDPSDFSQEYGTGNLDVRHSASATLVWESPWKLHNLAGKLANGWIVSAIGSFHSGRPYTMRTSGSLPKEFNTLTRAAIVGLGPGMNGSGGDNRVYGLGNDGHSYNIGRNTFRYPSTWKADLRLSRRFKMGQMRQLELLTEGFNLFNHRNVTGLETVGYTIESGSLNGALPTLNFLTGLKANSTAFGMPLNVNATNYYRERQLQVGLKFRF